MSPSPDNKGPCHFLSARFTRGLVSVIIPTFNRASLVKESVLSALSQSYPHVEVIVVDDGSQDMTEQRIKELIVRHGSNRLQYVKQSNLGAPAARNHGLRISAGEYIQFLDSDDLIHADKLQHQVRLLDDHPELHLTFCRSELFADNLNATQPGYWHHVETPSLEQAVVFPGWHTNAALWRRQAICLVGPWAEELGCYQEWEYHVRALSLGVQARGTPEVWNFVRREAGTPAIHVWGDAGSNQGHFRMGSSQPSVSRADGYFCSARRVNGHLARCGAHTPRTREHLAHVAGLGFLLLIFLKERQRAKDVLRWILSIGPSKSRKAYLRLLYCLSRLGLHGRALIYTVEMGRKVGRLARKLGWARPVPQADQ